MVHELKAALRKEMLQKRDSLQATVAESMSQIIAERLGAHPRFLDAKSVAFYLHKGSEVRTRAMIEMALRMGKKVLAPVTDDQHISFSRFHSFDELAPGKFGILEPKDKAPEPKSNEPDLIIVPGVSFGLCMHRLGYGRGYYDRYLAKSSAYRIGLCYDFQVMDRLPHHEDDERMDEIITEKRIIRL
jgi:5-formyltetrahydrofolate cyclo-ligase